MVEKPIKISVIIPIYNMEKYLEICLDSVNKQTLEGIEVICVDDGSTDGTLDILHNYEKKCHNIIVLEQRRQGAGAARNRALEVARGEFVTFMDSDDFYYDEYALEKLYNMAKEKQVLACGGSMISCLEGKLNVIRNPLRKKMVFKVDDVIRFSDYQFCFGYQRFIFNRLMLLTNRIKFPLYMRGQDPIFMARALSESKQFAAISDMVYVIRAFDKKIKFENRKVIIDLAKGFRDLMKFAVEMNYKELQELVLMELQNRKDMFWIHIYKGNTELWEVLKEMDGCVLDTDMKKQENYFLNYTMEDISNYIKKYSRDIERLKKKISQFDNIIIYGAGNIGKTVYDIAETMMPAQSIVFAVTDSNAVGTARGIRIRCINEFTDFRKLSLVIICSKEINCMEMKRNAVHIGFENIMVVNHEVFDAERYEIKDGCFSV